MTRKVAIFTETFLPKIDGMVTITCLLLEHLRRVDADVMLFASGNRVDEYAGYPVVSMRGLPVPIYPELELALPGPRVR
ncbi:MAG: glycosyltransferase family 1 protein, partial [Chloroflexota bacterium]